MPANDCSAPVADKGRTRELSPSSLLLEHTLAGAKVRAPFPETTQTSRIELLMVEMEPSTWRSFPRAGLGVSEDP
jgi:hypothetical protein